MLSILISSGEKTDIMPTNYINKYILGWSFEMLILKIRFVLDFLILNHTYLTGQKFHASTHVTSCMVDMSFMLTSSVLDMSFTITNSMIGKYWQEDYRYNIDFDHVLPVYQYINNVIINMVHKQKWAIFLSGMFTVFCWGYCLPYLLNIWKLGDTDGRDT